MVDSIDRSIDQILGNVESQRQGHRGDRGDRVRMNDEDLLSDYERLRLERMRQNAAVMESLGLSDAVFDINASYNQHGAGVGNGVQARERSSRRNVPSVPTRQMPARAAKSGEKRYYVPGEEDIREDEY